LREFVTVTVTVAASSGVLGFGFDAGAAFCANACAAIRPKTAAASAAAELCLLMNVLPHAQAA
jgi:hypothetical protein